MPQWSLDSNTHVQPLQCWFPEQGECSKGKCHTSNAPFFKLSPILNIREKIQSYMDFAQTQVLAPCNCASEERPCCTVPLPSARMGQSFQAWCRYMASPRIHPCPKQIYWEMEAEEDSPRQLDVRVFQYPLIQV